MDLPMALYVMVRASLFLLSQLFPARDFRMFVLVCILFCTNLPCAQNVNMLSNVSPSILGRVTVGICWLPMTRSSWVLTCLVQVVKSVDIDFSGEISSWLDIKQLCTTGRILFNFDQISSMLMLEDSNVQSSAYVISFMPSGGSGNRDMYRLNSVGDNTPPCGTPCLTLLYLELMCLNVTYVCLPDR